MQVRIPPLPFAAANCGGRQGWGWQSILQDERQETDGVFRAVPEKKDETGMKLTKDEWLRGAGRWMGLGVCLLGMAMGSAASAQAVTTTTVQGTVYLANGQAGTGTLVVSWPVFTTASGQAVAADSTTVAIAPDGFVSVNLAPNLGATPAGLYYTAVYYMSDGTSSTQYWVVPAAAQASLAQVQAQLMPAAQAVQTVSKSYVDESIAELTGSLLTASGGTLSGPLYLSGDPTQPLQAADKHYVDTTFSQAVPLSGGNMTGPLWAPAVNGVQSPVAGSSQTTLQAAMTSAATNGAMEIPPTYAGSDGFANPNGVHVTDLRPAGAQQTERSVKEFGAVCDGATDDTNALQTALNYAQAHEVALTIPEGTCKTRSLNWAGQSIGGLGKQVSALKGFPGQDVLASGTDAVSLQSYTRIHDLTIYVDQSVDISCSPAEGRAPAGGCQVGRPMEKNSIFSPGGSGLTGTAGTGAGWAVGNCAIAMPAALGTGGNGLRVAQIENLEIAATGVDPMAAQYPGAHSTHTCGLYLAQWPQWSEFKNIDIRGLNTGIAIPALPVTTPAGLNSDSNRWENITIQATHGFTAAAGSNNVLDNLVAATGNSAATGEPPTGLVLDLSGSEQGWTVRNAVVLPVWNAVQPQLTVSASGGAVIGVTVGPEHGLGFDPYGAQVPLALSGSCAAQAAASVNSDGSIGTVTVTAGGAGCSGTTTASVNAAGTWDTAAPVNLIGGQNMTFFDGNLLKGNGGYTVWNAAQSESYGTQLDGGGGRLPGGGSYSALAANSPLGAAYPVDQFPGADFGAKLQACLGTVSASYGGTCDARNFTGTLSMGSNLTISTANAVVLLPCATISTASRIVVPAGVRNVVLHGCSLRGISGASGTQGGTVLLYSGAGNAIQVGDPTYALDTSGFRMNNVAINTTGSTSGTTGFYAYRAQELHLESSYFLGNQNQTGMTIDGTGNYAGGTFTDLEFTGFLQAVNAIGHQTANPATTDWMNASTFVRLHIDCPESGGNPIAGTYGINLQQGDGNTFTGGDVEGCNTALHLGLNAQDNTIVGLRNENSNSQVVADAGSAYNSWITGGAMYTGHLTDNGTRNSFLDTFHRSFNGLNGDWYGSQQDSTLTNHYRLGIGLGNERGLLDRYQTDYGYRWTMGLSDATAGAQFYEILDELNNVDRLIIGQYLSATANTVTNVMVNNGGCYSSSTPATVAFSGGGGSGAAAMAAMTPATSLSCPGGYAVSSVALTNSGASYTSQPTVSFTGSNQTTAPSAVAEIATAGSTNDQSVLNSAGTGAVVLNGSTNSGTGGVVIGSGGPSETTVATIDNAGNTRFNGTLQVGGMATFTSSTMVKNQADAEIDQFLWAGLTTSQKESLIYKDWNGNSQWYMVKDQNNNWALNSAVGGLDSFKAYQSTNSGDTYIDASNPSGVVRINYETGSGTGFNIYGGGSTVLYASFTGANAIKFPGLAASSGLDCLQIDNSGYLSNTGSACGSGGNGSAGVSSLNSIAGAVNVVAGAGISVTPSGSSITIGNTGNGAPGVYYNVLGYGAKADMLPLASYVSASLTASSTTLYVPLGSFTSADVNKYVIFLPNGTWSAKPFSTGTSSAQIVSVTDGQHIVLSKPAAATENAYVWWGTDNVPAFNACAVAVYNAGGGGTCAIPVGHYLLATAPYYATAGMAQDDGGYATPAGGSGAVVTATIGGGAITGYTVANGGSGYPINSQMQVSFSGGCSTTPGTYTGPCGGEFAIANTNSSGQVASITAVYNGFGLTSAPAVSVVALGGDGAAAACTLSSGACGTPAITAGGSGYPASSSGGLEMWAFNASGGSCTQVGGNAGSPYVGKGTASTNSSGQVSSAAWTTAPSGCGTTAPVIVFGDVACWNSGTSLFTAQCANVAPLLPAAIPYQVSTFGGGWFAPTGAGQQGVVLSGTWDGVTVDAVTPGTMLTQAAIFGDYITTSDIGGLQLENGFIGIYDQGNLNRSNIHDTQFGGGVGMITAASDVGAQVNNLFFAGYGPWVNGGQWAHRTDYMLGAGGFFAPYSVSALTIEPPAYNSVAAAIDTWFANEFWRPEFTASATDMPERCAFPQTANQRQTSYSLSNSVGSANGMCYKGIAGFGMLNLARDNGIAQQLPITNIVDKAGYRPMFYGSLGPAILSFAGCEICYQISSDPYRFESVQEGAIEFSSAHGAQINSVIWAGSQIVQPIYDLSGAATSGVPGAPQDAAWQNIAATSTVNSQASQNLNIQSQIVNPQGELVSYNSSNNVQAALAFGNASSTSSSSTPTIAGGIKGDGYALGSYSLYGQNFTNKLATFYLDSFNIDAPFYFANGIAPSSGTSCLQVSSTGQVTSTGSACGSGAGTVSTFAAPTGNWPAWLVPTVTNATSTPSLAVAAQSTGTGSVVLANGPTFTGNATTFANSAAAEQDVTIQPGTGADQIGAFGWNNYAGTSQWKLRKDASNYLRLTDVVNSLDREILYQNGQTLINSGAGANAVLINSSTSSGTGGFAVESGGSSPAAVLSVTGSGNTTATGFVSGKFMMGSGTMSLGTGAAAGTGPAIACASGHMCDGVSGTVTLTTGTSTTTGTLATLSFPNTHTNSANCVVDVLQSGVGRVTTATWTESATAVTLTANTALTASTAYTVKYWCGGN
jgi:hypothetical protein